MAFADAIVFALASLVDLAVLVYLRRRRARRLRSQRIQRCLVLAVRRAIDAPPARPRSWLRMAG